jgi:ribosome-associated protein
VAKKPFGWVRDAEEPVVPSPPRATRADKQAAPRQAQKLARVLLELSPRDWEQLGLSDEVLEGLHAHRRIPAKGAMALKRQLGRLGTLLLAEDLDALEEALDGHAKGHTPAQDAAASLDRLRQRIVDGGKDAEADFVAAHPSADRQRLRQLAGAARKAAGTPKAQRANKKLAALLREAMQGD